MDLRSRVGAALKDAMRAKDATRLSTLRLISAAIKDRDIALRGEGRPDGAGDAEVLAILARMVRQRHESARAYEEGGRLDMAEDEREEIGIIEEFLPRRLGEGRGRDRDRPGRGRDGRGRGARHGPGDGGAQGALRGPDGLRPGRPDGEGPPRGLSGTRGPHASGICCVAQWMPPPTSPRASPGSATTSRPGWAAPEARMAAASASGSPNSAAMTAPLQA